MTPENPLVGSTVLRRPAIQSPNYVAGTTGWAVFADGTAEFNNVTLRGELVVGETPNPQIIIESVGGIGEINLPTNAAMEASPAQIAAAALGSGASEITAALFKDPVSTGASDQAYVELVSNEHSGGTSAEGVLGYADTSSADHVALNWDDQGVHIPETLYGTGGVLTLGDAVTMPSLTLGGYGISSQATPSITTVPHNPNDPQYGGSGGTTWVSGERAVPDGQIDDINANFSAIKSALQAAGIWH